MFLFSNTSLNKPKKSVVVGFLCFKGNKFLIMSLKLVLGMVALGTNAQIKHVFLSTFDTNCCQIGL